jgi:hypothetical protein
VLDAEVRRLAHRVIGIVEPALCPHAGGPPVCWCRPPLPGLILSFARLHGLDPARSAAPDRRTAGWPRPSPRATSRSDGACYGCEGAGGASSISSMRSSR